MRARGPGGEPRALQSPQPSSDWEAGHGRQWGAACSQSGLEASSPIRTHFPFRVQGPALRTVSISPAFQEVCQHLTLALDADLASAQEVVRTLLQQPVDLLCHLRGEKGISQ